jgi:AcrR family transcriptional regulator
MLQPVEDQPAPRPAGRIKRDTREEILNCAEELLQCRGFNGFSYQHIAVQLGIRNAAIHYHFPVKDDLGVALVQRYRERFHHWSAMLEGVDAWTQLQGYFSTYSDYLEADGGHRRAGGGVRHAGRHHAPGSTAADARDLCLAGDDAGAGAASGRAQL